MGYSPGSFINIAVNTIITIIITIVIIIIVMILASYCEFVILVNVKLY